MTDEQFMNRMMYLTEELCRIYKNEPIDQAARQAILDEVHHLGNVFNRSRRRCPWCLICFCVFLLYCLAWLAWAIWN